VTGFWVRPIFVIRNVEDCALLDQVVTGQHAAESDEGEANPRVLAERDRAVEARLRKEVVPAAQALGDDPGCALSADQVGATLKKLHERLSVPTREQRSNVAGSSVRPRRHSRVLSLGTSQTSS